MHTTEYKDEAYIVLICRRSTNEASVERTVRHAQGASDRPSPRRFEAIL